LKDLRKIIDNVSKEPSVYFLLGQTLKALEFEDQAIKSFALAKEFSSKNSIEINDLSKPPPIDPDVMKNL
jgi:hypothetical protein